MGWFKKNKPDKLKKYAGEETYNRCVEYYGEDPNGYTFEEMMMVDRYSMFIKSGGLDSDWPDVDRVRDPNTNTCRLLIKDSVLRLIYFGDIC